MAAQRREEKQRLRIGFSRYGCTIAVLQLLPNVLWALFPPSPDVLAGNASSVPAIELGEHVLGVGIVILLVFLVRQGRERLWPRNPPALVSYAAIGLYWGCWMLYFLGVQPLPLIYAMVVLPPIAFFCAGIAARVYPISAVSALFLGVHLLVALENFPLN